MAIVRKDTYRIRRTIVWLRRWRRTRGFGVHSPSDYYFIRHVINQHCPYYAYETLNRQLLHIDRKTRKVCKLCFRIANWMQPKQIILHGITEQSYQQYLHQGCQTAQIVCNTGETSARSGQESDIPLSSRLSPLSPLKTQLVITTADKHNRQFIDNILQYAEDNTILIVNGIHKSKQHNILWQQLRSNNKATITFDVYYCGIVMFNSLRTKQHYIINY